MAIITGTYTLGTGSTNRGGPPGVLFKQRYNLTWTSTSLAADGIAATVDEFTDFESIDHVQVLTPVYAASGVDYTLQWNRGTTTTGGTSVLIVFKRDKDTNPVEVSGDVVSALSGKFDVVVWGKPKKVNT